MDSDTKESILRAGIAAPSADNSQPWRFAWQQDTLDVYIDATRSGSISDSRFVLSDLATGACLENMLIRGRALGYAADVQIFPDSDDALWAVRIQWRGDAEPDDPNRSEPLAAAIETRGTDRRFPWSGTITDEVRTHLDDQAHLIDGTQLYWPESRDETTSALSIMRRAEALRFKSPTLHAELFSSIRFDAGWRSVSEEGLAPATLAVEPPLRPVFQMLRRPAIMRAFNRLGAAQIMGLRSAYMPARLSPGLCLLSTPATERADIIAGGRAMQRVWLQATLDGLSIQPYAAAGVLALGFLPIEPALQHQVTRLQADLRHLCPHGQGLVFLRLGYARGQPHHHHSGRRALASFGDPE